MVVVSPSARLWSHCVVYCEGAVALVCLRGGLILGVGSNSSLAHGGIVDFGLKCSALSACCAVACVACCRFAAYSPSSSSVRHMRSSKPLVPTRKDEVPLLAAQRRRWAQR